MKLTDSQKRFFYEEGYLVVSGAVSRLMVDAARQAVNAEIGKGNTRPFPEINKTPVITDLFNETPVFSLLESALGEGNLQRVNEGVPRLTFPQPVGSPAVHWSEKIGWDRIDKQQGATPHLDEWVGWMKNGRTEGAYRRSFTAFAVVYLDDVSVPHGGNFTIWPKSHRFFEDYFKEHGHQVIDLKGVGEGPRAYWSQQLRQHDHTWADSRTSPRFDLPEGPESPTAEAGDVVFAHHMMMHTGAANISPNIRYAVIFRAKHVLIDEIGIDAYTDMWREWDGIREVVAVKPKLVGSN